MATHKTHVDLEALWERLLSRNAKLVKEAFSELADKERESVLVHLKRMAGEPGWHVEQRRSARSALRILKNTD